MNYYIQRSERQEFTIFIRFAEVVCQMCSSWADRTMEAEIVKKKKTQVNYIKVLFKYPKRIGRCMDFLCVYTDRWKQKKRRVDATWRPELIIILWGCSYPLAWRVFSKGRVLGWLLIFFLISLNFSTFKMLHFCPLVSIIPDEKSVVICITFVTLCVFFLFDYFPEFFFFFLVSDFQKFE